MKNISKVNDMIIAKATKEAGIGSNEPYTAAILSREASLVEMVLDTEWNSILCYVDEETGEVFGCMAMPKSTEELLGIYRQAYAA